MKKHMIIGAGQLGSRHLQGLLQLTTPQQIYVVDPFQASLEIAATRAGEISHIHEIIYSTSLENIPAEIDLAIIATGSSVREQVTLELLSVSKVRFLVLEKVLFQQAASYDRVFKRLQETNTRTWVNHPRRMFAHYRSLKEKLGKTDGPKLFEAIGTDWGLGCNALHLLDIFTFVADAPLVSLETDWIDPVIHSSKRAGYIEFTGTLKASFEDGSRAIISSLAGTAGPLTITVGSATDKWLVQEGGTPGMIHIDSTHQYANTFEPIQLLFQSSLTTTLAQHFYTEDTCQLPTYEEAMRTHLVFLESMLSRVEQITEVPTDILTIT